MLACGLEIGLPPWWSHVLPTLGWALVGLGELEAACIYFEQVLISAQAQERRPIALDAQAGLETIQLLRARQDHMVSSVWRTERARALRELYHQPAAAAETRRRIVKLAAEFGLSVPETSMSG